LITGFLALVSIIPTLLLAPAKGFFKQKAVVSGLGAPVEKFLQPTYISLFLCIYVLLLVRNKEIAIIQNVSSMLLFRKHLFIRMLLILIALTGRQVLFAQTTASNFDSSLQVILQEKNDTARLGRLMRMSTNKLSPKQKIKLYEAVLSDALALKIDSTALQAYMIIGANYRPLDDYPMALKNFLIALSIAEKNNDYARQAEIYTNVAGLYAFNNISADLDKATEYVNKGLAIARKYKLEAAEITLMGKLAIIYKMKKEFGKAIETFKAAIAKAAVVDKLTELEFIANLGVVYKNIKQYDSAMAQYKTGLAVANQLSDDFGIMVIVDNMANLYYEMGQYPQSITMALDAINRSYKEDFATVRIDMYGCLKKIYEKQGNYKEAFIYTEKLMAVKDSVFDKEKSAQLKDMEEKYQTELKDKQINQQQGQISFNKNLNIILGSGALVLLFTAGLIYISMRKTARLNRTISKQRDELAKQSNTLSVMMKELHHRVKNNLQIVSSLLNLQSMRLSDEDAVKAVKESRERVQAMSLIHQRLYQTDDITGINMHEYIRDLADFLAASYGYHPDDIVINLDIEEKMVDVDKALPIGLILNELLTNAFKYAYEGIKRPRLDISFKNAGNNITLTVKDNGKGINPASWNRPQTGSFGRQLVKALCGQLRAKEHLEVADGSIFTFTIPQAA